MSLFSQYKLIIMRGEKHSGKSQKAHEVLEALGEKATIISRDEIRQRYLSQQDLDIYFENGLNWNIEEYITGIEYNEIAAALSRGETVIIDNSNTKKKHVVEYLKIAIDCEVSPEEVLLYSMDSCNLDWGLKECFEELKDYFPKQWILPKFKVIPYTNKKDCAKAIICDIDGTLAHRVIIKAPYPHFRGYYDYAECVTDEVDSLVASVLTGLYNEGFEIIFVTGRREECRKKTVEFLSRAIPNIPFTLFMRDPDLDFHNGKHDPDDVVKYRIFNDQIRDYAWDIQGVIEDRKRVIALWEALGLKVLNVGKLNKVF